MKAVYISKESSDLTSVNAARVSFGKTKDTFSDADAKLLSFLSRHNHFTPFTHIRVTFLVMPSMLLLSRMSETDMAGMVKCHTAGKVKVRHSIYGWASLLSNGLVAPEAAEKIAFTLHELYPRNAEALDIAYGNDTGDAQHLPDSQENDPRFFDVTLHIKCPFFVARQEFKHMIGFTRNEISRRYVDSAPEFMVMDWRERPSKSIKQGSGGRIGGLKRLAASAASFIVNAVCASAYRFLLWLDVAPEQARSVLPQSTYTEYYLTGSMSAYYRLINLRTEGTAQIEIQQLAGSIIDAIGCAIQSNDSQGLLNKPDI